MRPWRGLRAAAADSCPLSRRSARPARASARPEPLRGFDVLRPPFPAQVIVAGPLPVLAQPHLVENEEQGAAEPDRDQPDRERLPDDPVDQNRADRPRDDQRRGRSEGEDARKWSHLPGPGLTSRSGPAAASRRTRWFPAASAATPGPPLHQ